MWINKRVLLSCKEVKRKIGYRDTTKVYFSLKCSQRNKFERERFIRKISIKRFALSVLEGLLMSGPDIVKVPEHRFEEASHWKNAVSPVSTISPVTTSLPEFFFNRIHANLPEIEGTLLSSELHCENISGNKQERRSKSNSSIQISQNPDF